MDNTERKPTDQPDVNELQAQCLWLRRQVFSMLVLLVVVSGTLTIYLLRQYRITRADLKAIRPQAEQFIADYQKNTAPKWDEFQRKIAEYGRTHPDFTPIMVKFGLQPTSSAPATATTPKK